MQGLHPDLVKQVDAKALSRALSIQLTFKETLGTLGSAMLGLHTYLHAVTANTAHIDHLLSETRHLQHLWSEELTKLVHLCAEQRLNGVAHSDFDRVYLAEASAILTLAADLLNAPEEAVTDQIHRYQVYACSQLLGTTDRPEFVSKAHLSTLVNHNSSDQAVIFIRQFSQRLRNPELIKRELERLYAPIEGADTEVELNFI